MTVVCPPARTGTIDLQVSALYRAACPQITGTAEKIPEQLDAMVGQWAIDLLMLQRSST